jgi:pimeloyl-ACP methyl ester carboxylesterase
VIFIHGLGSSALDAWLSTADFFRSQGWTFGGYPTLNAAMNNVTTVFAGDFYALNFSDYQDTFRSQNLGFARQGAELAAIIQTVLNVNPGKTKVILIGHSMGGLAARAYLQGLAQVNTSSPRIPYRHDVAQLITIGTPHLGSSLADFCSNNSNICNLWGYDGTSVAIQGLRPNSEAFGPILPLGLNNLTTNPLPLTVRYISIIGMTVNPLLEADGDGIVSITSQNLRSVKGTDNLAHQSQETSIVKRSDCGHGFQVDAVEVHTCEPADSGVLAILLHQLINECDTLHSGDSVAAGFGVPWNVFDPNQLLLKAFCSSSSAIADVGPTTYVYNQGYAWTGSTWQGVNFTCTNGALVSNAWCPNSASAPLPNNSTYYAAYTCNFVNNQWKCGCRDQACATPMWQLQKIN